MWKTLEIHEESDWILKEFRRQKHTSMMTGDDIIGMLHITLFILWSKRGWWHPTGFIDRFLRSMLCPEAQGLLEQHGRRNDAALVFVGS